MLEYRHAAVPAQRCEKASAGERRDRRRMRRLVRRDRVRLAQGQRRVVEPLEQALARVVVELEREPAGGARFEVDRQLLAGPRTRHQLLHLLRRQLHRQEADLQRVLAEDVAEGRGDHDVEAVVLQRPRRVLARRAAAEVPAREQDPAALRVQLEGGVLHPVEEEELAEARALDALQELLRDDLVGVDVGAVEHDRGRGDGAERLHANASTRSRASAKCPAIAVAAATSGETRCVRPPAPWRPSKLRFDVDAQRSPGASTSGFMPRHIEQPARRHSKPASVKIRSSPSDSAWRFTIAEPGTTIARTPGCTRCPSTTCAAARRSSMREFVQEPMKTRSTEMSRIAVPGSSAMYASARSAAARSSGSSNDAGSGTEPSIETTMPGFVPQVTCGRSSETSISSSRSKTASSSVRRSRHQSWVSTLRSRRYAYVVSASGISPARAPASIDMLQIVSRPSIESASIAGPAYSTTCPTPPSTPSRPIAAST